MKLTRRKLVLGTVGAASLLPLSYILRVSIGGYEYPKLYTHLTPKEAVIVSALADTIIGRDNSFGIPPDSVDTVGAVNDFIAISTPLELSEIRTLFWAVEHALPILNGYFTKFTKLSVEQRTKVIKSLEESRSEIPKLLLRAVKTVICFGYFNTPQLQTALGVRGWCGP